jgi:hypothetical protein
VGNGSPRGYGSGSSAITRNSGPGSQPRVASYRNQGGGQSLRGVQPSSRAKSLLPLNQQQKSFKASSSTLPTLRGKSVVNPFAPSGNQGYLR